MKRQLITTLLLVLTSHFVNGQNILDSIGFAYEFNSKHIDKIKCYPLKTVKTFFDWSQPYKIMLPSEYELQEKVTRIPYRTYNPNAMSITEDLMLSTGWSNVDTAVLYSFGKYIKVENVIDTLIFNNYERRLQPFLISTGKVYNMCAVTMYRLRNDTITKYSISAPTDPLLLDFSPENIMSTKEQNEPGTYLITDFYYRKGMTTYFLNRTIIVIIK